MENTSRVGMAAPSNPLDVNHEEARLRHADRATPRTAFHVMPSGTVHDHFVERDGLRFAGTHLIIDLWQASIEPHLDPHMARARLRRRRRIHVR